MNHDRPARTLSLLMADLSPERVIRLSAYQCGNVSIRISSTPLVLHSTAQVNWFCGENAMQGRRKKQKTKGGRKTIKKINKEKSDKRDRNIVYTRKERKR